METALEPKGATKSVVRRRNGPPVAPARRQESPRPGKSAALERRQRHAVSYEFAPVSAPESPEPKPLESVPMPTWKRVLDLACIFLSLPVLLPVALLTVFWIKLVSRGPVLFRQERVGRGGKTFTIFKFRSMYQDAPTAIHENYVKRLMRSGGKLEKLDVLGDTRLIKGALILRTTGIDELPQLLNVIRGDMSIVGPRPCVLKEFDGYQVDRRRRFTVHPGLTGYWQVNGKTRTSFDEMVAMDEYYVNKRSLFLDLWILTVTPIAVLGLVIHCGSERLKRRFSKDGQGIGDAAMYARAGDGMTVTQKLAD